MPNSNILLEFLDFQHHSKIDPTWFRVLVIDALRQTCRRSIADKPFPESRLFAHRGTEIVLDVFSGMGIPTFTWDNACNTLRGLLEYEMSPAARWLDQIFRVHVGRYYIGVGRISPPIVAGRRHRVVEVAAK